MTRREHDALIKAIRLITRCPITVWASPSSTVTSLRIETPAPIHFKIWRSEFVDSVAQRLANVIYYNGLARNPLPLLD